MEWTDLKTAGLLLLLEPQRVGLQDTGLLCSLSLTQLADQKMSMYSVYTMINAPCFTMLYDSMIFFSRINANSGAAPPSTTAAANSWWSPVMHPNTKNTTSIQIWSRNNHDLLHCFQEQILENSRWLMSSFNSPAFSVDQLHLVALGNGIRSTHQQGALWAFDGGIGLAGVVEARSLRKEGQ